MKKIYILLFIGVLFIMKAQGQIITSSLQTELDNAGPSDMISVIIQMSDQIDCKDLQDSLLNNLPRKERRQFVVNELKSFADTSQQEIMNTITGLEALGQVENVRQFWIVNMIACKAKPTAINQLAQRQDISMLHIDEVFEIGEIVTDNIMTPPDTAYHIKTMNVPAVWEMGYEGEDVVVAVLDTGVDYFHPDLEGNMWEHPEYPLHGWNFVNGNNNPMDNEGHGTLVAGIIAGDGTMGTITGVAPKAKIMAIKVGFDGMFGTTFHSFFLAGIAWGLKYGADIFNISYENRRTNSIETLRLWRQVMDCVLEASCVAVVAVGNIDPDNPSGYPPNRIGVPGKIPPPWKHPHQEFWGSEGTQSAVVCVGAIDANGNLWEQSEYGPVTWTGVPSYNDYPYDLQNELRGLRRPDIVAPGVAITSLQANSMEYVVGSGTSFSAPAVAGVMALMLSKNPLLTPAELNSIIEMTAFHPDNDSTAQPQWRKKDNFLGSGSVDALAAIEMVPECDLIVYDNEVLNDTIFYCDIIVKHGGTLTINQKLWLQQGKKIIVEPGGKLFVTGSKISGYNNSVWQGIEVWGNSAANQLPNAQGNYAQGYVNLNNATIENALTAVNLWKPDDLTKTGGILIANNTVFRNNQRAVHAINYTNFINNPEQDVIEIDYVASFTRCSFEIDVNYPGAETFEKHVELSEVRGVKFLACDFSLVSSTTTNVSDLNVGIQATSAGFSVNAICTSNTIPCSSYDISTFTGFYKAIDAKVTRSTTRTFYVNRAQFHGNAYGIHVNGINNFIVLNSEFHIGFNAPEMDPCDSEGKSASGYGIFMSNCTGFAIEENYFTKKAGSANYPIYTGIHIAETQATDQVYRNTFNGLNHGNYAVGKNWYGTNTFEGLAYYCNENTGNGEDFTVEDVSLQPDGIQNPQGSTEMPAGNTFSTNANYNFNNWDSNDLIGYYFYAPSQGNTNTVYYPQIVNRVTRIEVVGIQNPCISNYGGGGSGLERDVVMTTAQKQQAEMEYVSGLSDYNNVKTLYNSLKDGGNTPGTLTEIETAWPSDMWELRAELLDKSPHLSMEVLKATADRTDVLPESVIFEIMAANPDELKKEELIKYLQDKDNPLPEYMIDILKQVAMGSTYKTVMQRQMAHFGQLKTLAAHNIIRSMLNDTISNNDELRNWFDNIGGKRADEQIIASYMGEVNFTNALALANMMPALYNYTGNALAEHSYYLDILNLQISLAQQGKTIFDLDSTEINNLVFMAENSRGTAGAQAKGILEYAYGYHYCNCIGIDNSGYKSSIAFNPGAFEKLLGIEITVEPNPAKEWAVFNYSLPDSDAEGVIRISDVSGKLIATLTITGKQGQKIWDTREIKSGVYFYTLHVSGFNKSGKIVVSK